MNIFSKIWDTIHYSLYQYGVIVQRDTDPNFVYDMRPPQGKGGKHRVIDLVSYTDYDTWEDVEVAYPDIDENNPSNIGMTVRSVDGYQHLAGDEWARVSEPGYVMNLRITALDDSLTYYDGFLIIYLQFSPYPHSYEAYPPREADVPLHREDTYFRLWANIENGATGSMWPFLITGTFEATFPYFMPTAIGFVRLIGLEYFHVGTSEIRVDLEIPKLRGESVWPQGIPGPYWE